MTSEFYKLENMTDREILSAFRFIACIGNKHFTKLHSELKPAAEAMVNCGLLEKRVESYKATDQSKEFMAAAYEKLKDGSLRIRLGKSSWWRE